MDPLTKFFRVAVSGATVDGREITVDQITQMAESYSQDTYGSRVWLEHLKSYSPDSMFRAYGDIVAAKAEKIKDGAHKGKTGLFVQIKPLPELIELNQKGQKVYTSIEVHPEHPTTKGAYLMGLAVTDTPASTGTEILKFTSSKVAPDHFHIDGEEAVELEIIETDDDADKPSLFSTIKALFSKKDRSDQQRFNDIDSATLEVAEQVVSLSSSQKSYEDRLKASVDKITKLSEQVTALEAFKKQIDEEEHDAPPPRSKSSGTENHTSKPKF